MVEITQAHKESRRSADIEPRITSNYQDTEIDWFDKKGKWGKVDVKNIETSDLWVLRREIEGYLRRQLATIDAELNNWTTIYCAVCGAEDLAHRGYPFVTWGIRGGYILCPAHLMRFDRIGTPEDELIKEARKQEKELKELFG